MQRTFCLAVKTFCVTPRNIWLGITSSPNIVLNFPLPKGAIWLRTCEVDKHYHWVCQKKSAAKDFWQRLRTYSSKLFQIFFLRFRLRGLGYRFRRITSFLYRFYFTKTNYIYFHRPPALHVVSRRKKIIFLSPDKHLLYTVFFHIIKLHKLSPYNSRGFVYPRRVFVRKPGKKII